MIDKMPFFFSFDGDQVTSLSQADKLRFWKICKTGCLAIYEKKIDEVINKRKMYKNSDNDNDRNEKVFLYH